MKKTEANKSMKIFDLRTEIIDDSVKLKVSVESDYLGSKTLWFSTPIKYEDFISKDSYDAFLVGILYPAMEYGENIFIKGKVSSKLLFNINNYVIPILKSFSSSCKTIKVEADNITNKNHNSKGVGTGFTGGVDSFCTIYDHYELEKNDDYKINSFVFMNVGSHGLDDLDKVRKKFYKRYNYLKTFPEEIGLDFVPIDSNLHSFHPWGHQKTHSLTSASGILFLQKLYGKYYYSSSGVDYNDMIGNSSEYKNIDIGAYCDPILLPLLSTESTDIIADGTQYTRVEKTTRILNYEPIKRYLNVCTSGEDTSTNCSVCSKCSRTLMTIDSLGRTEEFKNVFDIEKYKKESKNKFICKQMMNKKTDPFAKGNIDLAREKGINLPNNFYCYFVDMPRRLRSKVVSIIKSVFSESIVDTIKNKIGK